MKNQSGNNTGKNILIAAVLGFTVLTVEAVIFFVFPGTYKNRYFRDLDRYYGSDSVGTKNDYTEKVTDNSYSVDDSSEAFEEEYRYSNADVPDAWKGVTIISGDNPWEQGSGVFRDEDGSVWKWSDNGNGESVLELVESEDITQQADNQGIIAGIAVQNGPGAEVFDWYEDMEEKGIRDTRDYFEGTEVEIDKFDDSLLGEWGVMLSGGRRENDNGYRLYCDVDLEVNDTNVWLTLKLWRHLNKIEGWSEDLSEMESIEFSGYYDGKNFEDITLTSENDDYLHILGFSTAIFPSGSREQFCIGSIIWNDDNTKFSGKMPMVWCRYPGRA